MGCTQQTQKWNVPHTHTHTHTHTRTRTRTQHARTHAHHPCTQECDLDYKMSCTHQGRTYCKHFNSAYLYLPRNSYIFHWWMHNVSAPIRRKLISVSSSFLLALRGAPIFPSVFVLSYSHYCFCSLSPFWDGHTRPSFPPFRSVIFPILLPFSFSLLFVSWFSFFFSM